MENISWLKKSMKQMRLEQMSTGGYRELRGCPFIILTNEEGGGQANYNHVMRMYADYHVSLALYTL